MKSFRLHMFDRRLNGNITNEIKQDGHWFPWGWGGSSLQGLGPVDKQEDLNFTLLYRVVSGEWDD